MNPRPRAYESPALPLSYAATTLKVSIDGFVFQLTLLAVPPEQSPAVNAAACEQALFNAVNALKTGAGKAALTRNSYIDGLCRQHAQYMASKNTLSHDNATSRFNSIYATITATHTCGENVLQSNAPCAANAMAQLWWNSPGHKANIFEAKFAIAGMALWRIAAAKSGLARFSRDRSGSCPVMASPLRAGVAIASREPNGDPYLPKQPVNWDGRGGCSEGNKICHCEVWQYRSNLAIYRRA